MLVTLVCAGAALGQPAPLGTPPPLPPATEPIVIDQTPLVGGLPYAPRPGMDLPIPKPQYPEGRLPGQHWIRSPKTPLLFLAALGLAVLTWLALPYLE